MSWNTVIREILLALSASGLTIGSCLGTGCVVHLDGSGEIGLGMRASNEVYVRHTVDGDKAGSTSKAGFNIDDRLMEAVLPDDEDRACSITDDPAPAE